MEWDWKERDKQKTLFKSYYCAGCKQRKVCGKLNPEYCCSCYYQMEQEKAEKYSDYQQVYQKKEQEQKEKFQQLQILKNYSGCPKCGSLAVDAYSLYEESQLICQPCRTKKEGGSSQPISFTEQQKWYKKQWKISISEWLENFSRLPVNKNCADKWLKDRNHLNNCQCLEQEAKNLVDLFTSSLKKYHQKLAKCSCKTSEKFRVDSDSYAWCESCQEPISAASKKRVIKNRNDPKFWGLNVKEKVLCGNCLENKKKDMTPLRRAKFNEYRKLGRL